MLENTLEIVVEKPVSCPGCVLVRLRGDVSAETEAALDTCHEQLFNEKTGTIIYDFSGMRYINSAGLAALLDYMTTERPAPTRFRGFGMTPHFSKIIRMVGMDGYLELFDSEAAALRG